MLIHRKIGKHVECIGNTETFSNGNSVYTFSNIQYAKDQTEKLEPPKSFVYPDDLEFCSTEASTPTPENIAVDNKRKGITSS